MKKNNNRFNEAITGLLVLLLWFIGFAFIIIYHETGKTAEFFLWITFAFMIGVVIVFFYGFIMRGYWGGYQGFNKR